MANKQAISKPTKLPPKRATGGSVLDKHISAVKSITIPAPTKPLMPTGTPSPNNALPKANTPAPLSMGKGSPSQQGANMLSGGQPLSTPQPRVNIPTPTDAMKPPKPPRQTGEAGNQQIVFNINTQAPGSN